MFTSSKCNWLILILLLNLISINLCEETTAEVVEKEPNSDQLSFETPTTATVQSEDGSGGSSDESQKSKVIYSIIAPKSIIFQRPYKFIASIESCPPYQEPIRVVAYLEYERPPPSLPEPIPDPFVPTTDTDVVQIKEVKEPQSNKTILAQTEFTLDPSKPPTKSIMTSLLIGDKKQALDMTNGWINFIVQGTHGYKFEERYERLQVNEKKSTNFLQMDKPIYKAGESVKFRIVSLDPFMLPNHEISKAETTIVVKDSRNLIVKQWKNVTMSNGLFSSQMPLSSDPNLGSWKIEVKNGKTEFRRNFQVDEYVLPKVKVDMLLPAYGTFTDTKVLVRIDASYTFGKGVAGEVKVRGGMKNQYYYYQPQPRAEKKASEKTIRLDESGKAQIEFSLQELQFKTEEYETQKEVEFSATITEMHTEKQYNVTKTLILYKHAYKITQIGENNEYKPGLPYSVFLKVSYQDDTPIVDTRPDALQVFHGFAYDLEDAYANFSIPESAGGIVKMVFRPPTNTMLSVNSFEVTYKDLKTWIYPGGRAQSTSNCYLQVTPLTKSEHMKELNEVEFDVQSNKVFSELTYVLSSRGELVFRKQIKVPEDNLKNKKHRIKFTLPKKSSPTAHLVVFTLCSAAANRDIMGDHLKLEVHGGLDNYLNITADKDTYGPGDSVKFTLKSKANSIIALRGIDQSVLLMGKEDPDITRSRVNSEINSYDQRHYGWWNPEDSVPSFDKAGLYILTNMGPVKKPKVKPVPHHGHHVKFMSKNGAGAPMAMAQAAFASPPSAMRVSAVQESSADFSTEPPPVEIQTRKKFPETWLWQELPASQSDENFLQVKIPDTLTSWLVTGFSLNDVDGLGVSDSALKLKTFRPFFITLNLPAFVIRNEIVTFQVLVHNYMKDEVEASIIMDNPDGHFSIKDGTDQQKVRVRPNSVGAVSITVEPLTIGFRDLHIKAVTKMAGDGVQVPLLIKAPGEQRSRIKSVLIDLRNSNDGTKPETHFNLTSEFPPVRVEGADKMKMSFIGDLLGNSLSNIDNLIQLPQGCGEQNMLNFVPDIVIMDYLKATNRINDDIRNKAINFLEQGYQRELTYRHQDGSFSAFGNSDTHGSTWLTAFVARSFIRAKRYITIDEKIIKDSLTFLAEKQEQSGNFVEAGKVIHSDMQGSGAGKGLPITAYTLLAFIEYARSGGKNATKFAPTIDRGISYLVKSLDTTEDFYTVSLMTFALHLAEDESKDKAFKKLEAMWKTYEREFFHELKKDKDDKLKHPWEDPSHTKPKSSVVESMSYYMLTLFLRGVSSKAVPLVKRLLSQMNEHGGFSSTQDTVVGITALADFAVQIYSTGVSFKIQMKTRNGNFGKGVVINDENSIVTQEFDVPPENNWVSFDALGQGVAFAQLISYYNILNSTNNMYFRVEANASDLKAESFQLSVCFEGIEDTSKSNMAVLEVNLPTGFQYDSDDLLSLLKQSKELKRFDRDREFRDTKLFLYFDSITKNRVCLKFNALRTHVVENMSPAYVLLYDYYDNEKRERMFYKVETGTTRTPSKNQKIAPNGHHDDEVKKPKSKRRSIRN